MTHFIGFMGRLRFISERDDERGDERDDEGVPKNAVTHMGDPVTHMGQTVVHGG